MTGTADTSASAPVGLRSLIVSVYLPTLLFAVGQGAVIPVVALTATDLGASVAVAGVAVAANGIGTMLFDIPAGNLVERYGERRAMAVGTTVLVGALVLAVLSPNVWVFLVAMFIMGCAWSVWLLARLTYVSDVMPFHLRGRALSTLGGVNRIGNFIGPFVGAVAIAWWGLAGAYWVHVVVGVVAWLVLVKVPDPTEHHHSVPVSAEVPPIREIVTRHRMVFLTAGLGTTCLSVLRVSRHAILPLWGAHIGLDAAQVSLIFGISSGMDMLLFYPAGLASDRLGRKAVAVPCLAILALGFLLVPLAQSFWSLVAVGILIGLGNGMGSGIVMTLGADFSPAVGRASFLGVWRLISDIGKAGGPLVAAGVAAIAGLGPASVTIGGLGIAGASVFWFAMPEPSPDPPADPRTGPKTQLPHNQPRPADRGSG